MSSVIEDDVGTGASLDYDLEAIRMLFSQVEKGARSVAPSGYFGIPLTSPTSPAPTEPYIALYADLKEFQVIGSGTSFVLIHDTDITFNCSGIQIGNVQFFQHRQIAKDSVPEQFAELSSKWKRETSHLSRTDQMVSHPAYRQIIELGDAVVPFILTELEANGGYWFDALSEITHYDPLPPGRHTMKELAGAWIAWGKKNAKHP